MEENQPKYEHVFRVKQLKSLLFLKDFKPEESNRIITGLVDKIKYFEQDREIQIGYEESNEALSRGMRNKEEADRIDIVTINSKDGVVNCGIKHQYPTFMTQRNGMIYANLDFNSNDESLRSEYEGLVKILTNELKQSAIII